MALLLLVEHGGVQRQTPPGPVLAGEHHHGGLHAGDRLRAGPLHVGRGHGEPVGVGVPGLQPAVWVLLLTLQLAEHHLLLNTDFKLLPAAEAPPTEGPLQSLRPDSKCDV